MTRIFVISEEAAKDGIGPFLDFSFRNEQIHVRSFLLITKGKASDVIRWKSQRKGIPADAIAGLLQTDRYFSTTMTENLQEFAVKFTQKTTSPITSGIEIAKGAERETVRISGTATFKGEKLAGWLNLYETKGLQWILNKYGKGEIEVKNNAGDQTKTSIRLTRSHSKLDPEVINKRIVMHVEVKAEGEILQSDRKVTSQDVIRSLESKLNKEVNKEVEACLNMVQKIKDRYFRFWRRSSQKRAQRVEKSSGKMGGNFPRYRSESKYRY